MTPFTNNSFINVPSLWIFILLLSFRTADGYCNWGPDGTGATSTCEGGSQGGSWCNANSGQCEQGCGGNWCEEATSPPPPTSPPTPSPTPAPTPAAGCPSGWTEASWTTYTSYAPCCPDSPNYDEDAPTTECDLYSACDYTGAFAYLGYQSFEYVSTTNIIAFFSTYGDNESYGNRNMRIQTPAGITVEALVADTCGDSDCNGCCSTNAAPSGYLVDMEYWTVVRNFGSASAANGPVCWQLVPEEDSDDDSVRSGYCNWGPDGTRSTSTCQGGAQGGEYCNGSIIQCESDCGGRWCTY